MLVFLLDVLWKFLKDYMRYIILGLILLFIASIIMTAVISRRCNGKWNPRTGIQTNSDQERISHYSHSLMDDDDASQYDIINEQDMLSVIQLQRIEISRHPDVSCSQGCKSLTALENLYLDVVDSDYMFDGNSYQEFQSIVTQAEIHTYSTIKPLFRRNTL